MEKSQDRTRMYSTNSVVVRKVRGAIESLLQGNQSADAYDATPVAKCDTGMVVGCGTSGLGGV